MKSKLIAIGLIAAFTACQSSNEQSNTRETTTVTEAAPLAGQSEVQDDESQKDVVKVAVGLPDHTHPRKSTARRQFSQFHCQ